MKKQDFVNKFYPSAKASQNKTGIPALANLAQAAVESAWGEVCPGNMLFGVKDTDGINGNEQLLVTTEYSKSANTKFPNIISVTPVVRNGQKWFKYKIKDYFRKYNTLEDCFTDHAQFFIKNKRYAKALLVKHNTYLFIDEIAKAGYATDPNYAKLLRGIAKDLEKYIPKT
ncbi:glucosaminidase domain-containing protein [Flavobacterium branchiarum]|uniref:Glycoside hydrolase family 73 protein n=1 Tax=Flavobacterium branchiarum TaxID=1114870 RepID=A0ABV5FRE6_9FLAO|nr:glucosaminidase domain-containing protein [Flavobacterium branchiarum]MDN3671689.1 glucosaminidase domain-containing protein [Flavobacterium branchiarum]